MSVETMPIMGSTRLTEAEYDDSTDDLTLTFTDGRRYVYHNVPRATYRSLGLASSKGEFFDRSIKNRFPFEEL